MNTPGNSSPAAGGATYWLKVAALVFAAAFTTVLLGALVWVESRPPTAWGGFPSAWNPITLGLVVALTVAGTGLIRWRGWQWPTVKRVGIITTVISGGAAGFVGWKQREIELLNMAVVSTLHQLHSASNQYYLENSVSALVSMDELIGPDRYVKAVTPLEAEDYRALFPRRQDDLWLIKGVAGRTVWFDRQDMGKPAPLLDGVYQSHLAEVSYRGGLPHGPHRVFDRDRRLRLEVVYETGRLVSGRVLAVDGRTAREVTDPATARQAFDETLAAVLSEKSR